MLREGNVMTCVCLSTAGSHVTITHDVLNIIKQEHSSAPPTLVQRPVPSPGPVSVTPTPQPLDTSKFFNLTSLYRFKVFLYEARTVYKRAVGILLGCFLVLFFNFWSNCSLQESCQVLHYRLATTRN